MAQTRRHKKSPLEDNLLNEEERAVLYELDQSFLTDSPDSSPSHRSCLGSCVHGCRLVLWDKGTISMLVSFVIMAIGVTLLAIARENQETIPVEVQEFSMYLISAGVFGLAGGGTNAIAVFMLLYKIPLLWGSGVFYKRHELIKQVIKSIVLQLLFDSQHLENYITRKINHFSSRVRIVDNITLALDSPETEAIINERLSYLYSQPESYYLQQVGFNKDAVKSLVKPAILSLCAESAPHVVDTAVTADSEQALSVGKFREQMDHYLSWRVMELSESRMGAVMRGLIYRQLGWLVVWGCVFGLLTGLVSQAAKISLNFNFRV